MSSVPSPLPPYDAAALLRRPLRPRRGLLAADHGGNREQALLALAGALVVVEEFEFTLAQLKDRHVGGCADVERAAVVERRENARGIDRAGCDHCAQRNAEHVELSDDIRLGYV